MQEADEHRREITELRERLTRLSEASLRVNESLDPDTVLQEVMDSARSLTGARFGGITAFDESGRLLEFITSGMPPEEQQRMLDLPEGPALFEYFSSIQGSPEIRGRGQSDAVAGLSRPADPDPAGSADAAPGRGTWAISTWPRRKGAGSSPGKMKRRW